MQATPRHKLQKPAKVPTQPTSTIGHNHVPFTNLTPQTPTEHYWASRAYKAEALLSARDKHHEEVGRVRQEEGLKRDKDLQILESRYKEKHDRLEKLIHILITALVLLITLVLYLLMTSTSHDSSASSGINAGISALFSSILPGMSGRSGYRDTSRNSASWLNLHLHLPSHFTIPILSPWTSVIENQASAITNTSASSFSKHLIIAFLSCAAVSILAFSNAHFKQTGDKNSHEQAPGRTNRTWWLITHYDLLSPIAVGRLTWNLGNTLLRLLGFTPR